MANPSSITAAAAAAARGKPLHGLTGGKKRLAEGEETGLGKRLFLPGFNPFVDQSVHRLQGLLQDIDSGTGLGRGSRRQLIGNFPDPAELPVDIGKGYPSFGPGAGDMEITGLMEQLVVQDGNLGIPGDLRKGVLRHIDKNPLKAHEAEK